MIVTFATENYKDYLILLLDSYIHFNPQREATIYLLGWSDVKKNIIKQKYKSFIFKDIKINNDFLDKVARNKRIGEILKNKPEYLLKTYKEHKGPVLWIDADSIVLGSIKPLLNKLNSSNIDLMCTHRPNHAKDHAKFAVAVLGFGNHRGGMELLKKKKYRKTLRDVQNDDEVLIVRCSRRSFPQTTKVAK